MTSRVTCLTTGRRTTSLITRYGADDFRDFLDLVEWDLNLNDRLDVPDLRELDDLLDLLEDWLLPDAPLGAGHLVHPLNDTLTGISLMTSRVSRRTRGMVTISSTTWTTR